MSIYQEHRPGNTDDLYLKLRDGDRVKLRIVSEPAIVLFKEGQRPRYAWVVVNHDKGKAQVYGAGVSVYSQIAELTEEWGSPDGFDIIVKRTGAGQFDTEYSVTPVKQSVEPTKDQLAEVEKIELLKATKGKWLSDYMADGQLPEPVSDAKDEIVPMPEDKPAQNGYKQAAEAANKLRTQSANDEPDPEMPPEFLT